MDAISNGSYARTLQKGVRSPRGINGRLRAHVRGIALDLLGLRGPSATKPFLTCLYCHYVFDDQRETFERIVVELGRMGTFVSTDRCVEMIASRTAIQGPCFHLSFDDGFRNNFTNAFPILQKHSIPAAFFVPTRYVGADWAQAKEYCFGSSESYSGVIEMITWKDLCEMRTAGHTIGSHTRSHVRLSSISHDAKRLEEEIAGSKAEIEAALGCACKYISWPYGRALDIDARAVDCIRQAGYQGCFSAIRGSMTPTGRRVDPYCIPRQHFEPQWPVRHVRLFACGRTGSGA